MTTTLTIDDHRLKIAKAKRKAAEWMPFLQSFFQPMRCTPVSHPSVKTACVDQYGRMYYSPEFINSLSVEVVAYVILHECLHCVLSHCKRTRRMEPNLTQQKALLANIAQDLCIQQTLAREVPQFEPEGIVRIDNWNHIPGLNPGRTSEQYYEALLAHKTQRDEERAKNPPPKPPQDEQDEDEDEEDEDDGHIGSESDEDDDLDRDEDGHTGNDETEDDAEDGDSEQGDDESGEGDGDTDESDEDDEDEDRESVEGDGDESDEDEGGESGESDGGDSESDSESGEDGDSGSGTKGQPGVGKSGKPKTSDQKGELPDDSSLNPEDYDFPDLGDVCNPADAGSNSDGVEKEWEEDPSMADIAQVEHRLRKVEEDLDELAPTKGSGAGNIRQALKARLRPIPDPFDQLRHVVSRSIVSPIGQPEATYRKWPRRTLPGKARLRGVQRLQPEATILLDTSGSMESCSVKAKALAIIAKGISRLQNPRIVCCDGAIQSAKRVANMSRFTWDGGGGTDMAAGLIHTDQKYKPDTIVIVTDGITDWPRTPTRAKVVCALCRPDWASRIPKWITVVHLYKQGEPYVL